MKKIFIGFIFLLLSIGPVSSIPSAGAQGDEPEGGTVVCAPGAYPEQAGDCLLAGPSSYMTEMETLGLTFPPRPILSGKPDPSLPNLP